MIEVVAAILESDAELMEQFKEFQAFKAMMANQ